MMGGGKCEEDARGEEEEGGRSALHAGLLARLLFSFFLFFQRVGVLFFKAIVLLFFLV